MQEPTTDLASSMQPSVEGEMPGTSFPKDVTIVQMGDHVVVLDFAQLSDAAATAKTA